MEEDRTRARLTNELRMNRVPELTSLEGTLKGVHAKATRRTWIAEDIDSVLRSAAGITGQTPGEQDLSVFSPFGPITRLFAGLRASVFTIGFVRRARRGQASGKVSG